ncbi:MAG: beta-glucuronidase [Lachnospiraceae bacterium]|nr:beta-glucuronidase [Lachnospiraceae bacterium]
MGTKLNLAGEWSFCLDKDKKGLEGHFENIVFEDSIVLPNSTAYAKKGEANRARETYFLTEVYKFEGYSWYKKSVKLPLKSKKDIASKHFYLTLERTRKSYVWVDGKFVGKRDSFIAKHVYDLTGFIDSANPEITIMVSNTDYVANGGHMTSPDTQTNWNGILGEISLEICEGARLQSATTFCDFNAKKALIKADIESFDTENIEIKIGADLCILKSKLLAADSDISAWETRADKEQALATDFDILDKYLDIKKGAVPVTSHTKSLNPGENKIELELPLGKNAKTWDEEEPYVYRIKFSGTDEDGAEIFEKYLWFGLREFKAAGDKFEINGTKTFLRGRHQGMLFPLSGFAPMNVTGWLKDFKIAKDWGINHERCHTATPPEAAFIAADLLGIYFQPEIPFWGTWHGENEDEYGDVKDAQEFLKQEGFNIINEFAGHPSFVMMSMGNELWGDKDAINELMGGYKELRPDIMYTQGSNNFQWVPNILPNDDFFSGVRFTKERQIRGSYAMCDAPLGRIQKSKPSTDWNYDEAIKPSYKEMSAAAGKESDGTIEIQYGTGVKRVKLSEAKGELVPEIPVVSHEIGQYFIYPDYNEITQYNGVCQARNLEVFQERLEDMSLTKRADGYFRSSGALAIECYKNELEAALRSSCMAGFQILDLQDYSGQGTALVGPLNALMKNKGLISPMDWREFCSAVVVLGEFSDFVFSNGDDFRLNVKLSYYKKSMPESLKLKVTLINTKDEKPVYEKETKPKALEGCGLYEIGAFDIKTPKSADIEKYVLNLKVYSDKDLIAENHYTLWGYDKAENIKVKTDVFVAEEEDGSEHSFEVTESGKVAITTDMVETDAAVDCGKSVLFYLNPSENRSLPGAYCTDFWNYPMFKSISESMGKPIPVGTLGTLIAKDHPALKEFKCEDFTTPQWYEIIERSRVSMLNWLGFRPIVTVIDNCESNDNLGIIYEFMLMDGKAGPSHVVVCTSPLRKLAQEGNAPAAALEKSLLNYLEEEPVDDILRTHMQQLRRLAY